MARIKQAFADAARGITNDVTARGILSSGETGWQHGRNVQDLNRANYDARQSLADYLGGLRSSFANSERTRQRSLADLLTDLIGRWPEDWGTPPTQPTTPATTEDEPIPDEPGKYVGLGSQWLKPL